jgi:hypothetical protein
LGEPSSKKITSWFELDEHGDSEMTYRHAVFNKDLEDTLSVLKSFIRPTRPPKATEAPAEDFYVTSESLESKLQEIHVGEPATGHVTNRVGAPADENVMDQDNTEENDDSLPMLPRVHIEKDESEL